MFVEINGNRLNVEVTGPEGAPVLIAHHGGGGLAPSPSRRRPSARWRTGSALSCSMPSAAA